VLFLSGRLRGPDAHIEACLSIACTHRCEYNLYMDDLDDLDFILSDSEEEKQAKQESSSVLRPHMRSAADDILDAVAGQRVGRVDLTKCPLCEGPTKVRGPTVGVGMRSRKCKKCGHQYAIGMMSERTEVDKPPLVPQVGPFDGEGGPPIDANQPIQRRLAEYIRRVRDHES
jgi:hypothetical protein